MVLAARNSGDIPCGKAPVEIFAYVHTEICENEVCIYFQKKREIKREKKGVEEKKFFSPTQKASNYPIQHIFQVPLQLVMNSRGDIATYHFKHFIGIEDVSMEVCP